MHVLATNEQAKRVTATTTPFFTEPPSPPTASLASKSTEVFKERAKKRMASHPRRQTAQVKNRRNCASSNQGVNTDENGSLSHSYTVWQLAKHHKYVAPLSPREQKKWLTKAEKEGWSTWTRSTRSGHCTRRSKGT